MSAPANSLERSDSLSGWLVWLGLLAQAAGLALVIGTALMLLVALGANAAQAQGLAPAESATAPGAPRLAPGAPLPDALARLPRSEQPPEGTALLFHTTAGLVSAPLQASKVQMRVTGTTVRAVVRQTYRNPSEDWLDASYQFPLPDEGAVDGLRLRVGHRVIEGEIQERATANRTFETARRAGQRAALVSQHRPNVFTARVANIEPWSEIAIEIEYQQSLRLTETGWSLHFPTVVAPRYEPMPDLSVAGASPQPPMTDGERLVPMPVSYADAATSAGFDAHQPTLLQADPRANRIHIDVQLQPGMPVTTPVSTSHVIEVEKIAALPAPEQDPAAAPPAGYAIRFAAEALADRDFVLQWSPLPGERPAGNLQIESHQGELYGQLNVAPPDTASLPRDQAPREITFVIDTSGSMHGASLAQARGALRFGLERLGPDDRFNVIQFNDRFEALFRTSVPATAANLAKAGRYVDRLEANGGTEMKPALAHALQASIPAGFLSQVVFITDGAVGNEDELFDLLDARLGSRRLFTIGIGSAPNSWFMRQAAVTGRGSFTLIAADQQLEAGMARLFRQLAHPALTDLQLTDVHGERIDTGAPIRDLYAGDPVVINFPLTRRPDAVFLTGRMGRQPWQQEISVTDAPDSGIHKRWAKTALEQAEAQIRRQRAAGRADDELRIAATRLALTHQLVSPWTSLVAVDRTPARPLDQPAREAQVPRQFPAGGQIDKVFGSQGQTLASGSTGLWLQFVLGAVLLLLALLFAATALTRAQDLVQENR
ncbi:MAG: marine proteobacterial sortase target protein [Burkholderiaceae bacterium]